MKIPSLHSGRINRRPRSGMALVLTLLTLALMTIVVVSFVGAMTWELTATRRDFENQKARSMAELGMNTAVAQIRLALGVWDNPLVNFTNTIQPYYYWSVSPGIITRWSYTNSTALTNYPLFSQGSTNLVDLNAKLADGSYPIAGATTLTNTTTLATGAPPVNIYWANVLANPSVATSSSNTIIGRYAYWVDDENAKININTADGTLNTNLPPSVCGLGPGTPSAVSLQVLQMTSANLPLTAATNIVAIARVSGFNSPKEILRAAGTAPDLYTNNVFNLTTFSRSPELNVFGQPKIALVPITATAGPEAGASFVPERHNAATLLPPFEFYPEPAQLPSLALTNIASGMTGNSANSTITNAYSSVTWPVTFLLTESDSMNWQPAPASPSAATNGWVTGKVIANYLAGTNATGQQITWPAFTGTTETSYSGKYTPRQIDSVTVQICDLVDKDFSPDYGYDGECEVRSASSTILGWLSGQVVSGLGRSPRLSRILMSFKTQPQQGTAPVTSGPQLYTAAYLELWMPSQFQGVSLFHSENPHTQYGVGTIYQPYLNIQDLSASTNLPPAVATYPAALPKIVANGGTFPATLANTSYSYWANDLLTTDRGVDFQGNSPNTADPDQSLATAYHPYLAKIGPLYKGSGRGGGTGPAQILTMNAVIGANTTPYSEWAPGEVRCLANNNTVQNYGMQFSTNAVGIQTAINIGGGIAYLDNINYGRGTDNDPVPLDAMRGAAGFPYASAPVQGNPYNRDNECFLNSTVFSRATNAVIPMAVQVQVGKVNFANTFTGWAYAHCADPFVNKFPGDWIVANTPGTAASTSVPSGAATMGYLTAQTAQPNGAIYSKYLESALALTDPESYWVPTMDCNASMPNGYSEPPQIPRTARFPSSGYLQYVRTGIIPDDETQPYTQQHGTPFRLLNFASSSDATQKLHSSHAYPDWAMLDLFFSPSSLLGYGSPYETFAGAIHSHGSTPNALPSYGHDYSTVTYANTNVMNNMFRWGTHGGATSGRINPNGSVLYTTNSITPTPGIYRTAPMQAMLHGIVVNQSMSGATVVYGTNDFHVPNYSGGTLVDDAGLSRSIANYMMSSGPLRMPAEICNISDIGTNTASVNATRNDLVRQVVGNLTTQSNTFSIWVEGQSIAKTKGNTDYGNYEATDQITSTVRYHFVIERSLDLGADGVYGNTASPGSDGVAGTLDDAFVANYNPKNPGYKYRIVYSEEVR